MLLARGSIQDIDHLRALLLLALLKNTPRAPQTPPRHPTCNAGLPVAHLASHPFGTGPVCCANGVERGFGAQGTPARAAARGQHLTSASQAPSAGGRTAAAASAS